MGLDFPTSACDLTFWYEIITFAFTEESQREKKEQESNVEEEEENKQKTEEGEEEEPRMTVYLCQELGTGTQYTDPTAGNSERLDGWPAAEQDLNLVPPPLYLRAEMGWRQWSCSAVLTRRGSSQVTSWLDRR